MDPKVIALTNHIDHAKILDEASDPLATLNSHYQFTYANKALAKALGITLEVIIGNDLWEIYSKDGADIRRDAIKEVFETGHTKVIETIVPKPSGNLYFIMTFKPIFNEQNIVISVVAIAKDITERKQAEEELAKHREHLEEMVGERTVELEEKNKELERFNNLFVNREFRIKALKDKVKALDKKVSKK